MTVFLGLIENNKIKETTQQHFHTNKHATDESIIHGWQLTQQFLNRPISVCQSQVVGLNMIYHNKNSLHKKSRLNKINENR